MQFDLQKLIRSNIKNLKPYSSARHEFTGKASVFLDANENAYGSPISSPKGEACPPARAGTDGDGLVGRGPWVRYNRYPDPLQWQLKFQLARIKGVPAENIFIGNGSDEIIDLAFRICCNPGRDNVIICPPTYGMYAVSAGINDVEARKVNLEKDFQLDVDGIMRATDSKTKLLFICSPNNPTGNNMNRSDIITLLENFPGIVIIDEAYINYSKQQSFIPELITYPNLIVMQTLSKAWGLAALRLGLCFASLDIIDLFNKIKPPYNINEASQQIALEALQNTQQVNAWTREVVEQKQMLAAQLKQFSFINDVYHSDANFIMVKASDADALYSYLAGNEVVVRNRSKESGCANCLRISIGTPEENQTLISTLKNYEYGKK